VRFIGQCKMCVPVLKRYSNSASFLRIFFTCFLIELNELINIVFIS